MYSGFMTASFVDYMEQNSYDQAVRSYCIPPRKSQRLSMPTLFDTIAGSETGAIIASALVIPSEDKATGTDENNPNNKTNKNWAMDVKRWFYDNTDRLYKNDHVPGWAKFLIGIFFAAIFAGIGYKLAEKHYHDPHYDGNL